MQLELQDFAQRAVSPFIELGAYEALWEEPNTTFKTLADMFARREGTIPSDFVEHGKAARYANEVHSKLKNAGIEKYGIRVHGAGEYPGRLRDADHPVELLYFQGWWELVNSPRSVAVVGTRNPSPEGLARTKRLVTALVSDNFTVVSGLAAGIDTIAHETAISEGGKTIAVLGTPSVLLTLPRGVRFAQPTLQRLIAKTSPARHPHSASARSGHRQCVGWIEPLRNPPIGRRVA